LKGWIGFSEDDGRLNADDASYVRLLCFVLVVWFSSLTATKKGRFLKRPHGGLETAAPCCCWTLL